MWSLNKCSPIQSNIPDCELIKGTIVSEVGNWSYYIDALFCNHIVFLWMTPLDFLCTRRGVSQHIIFIHYIYPFCFDSAAKMVDPDWKAFTCMIYFTGMVIWSPSGTFTSSCDLNMYKFPFDTQMCSLGFGNLAHRGSSVHLLTASSKVQMAFFVPNKQFRYG